VGLAFVRHAWFGRRSMIFLLSSTYHKIACVPIPSIAALPTLIPSGTEGVGTSVISCWQTVADTIVDQLRGCLELHLLQDPDAMCTDRLTTDAQCPRNLRERLA
jgi:hypothetical protein